MEDKLKCLGELLLEDNGALILIISRFSLFSMKLRRVEVIGSNGTSCLTFWELPRTRRTLICHKEAFFVV